MNSFISSLIFIGSIAAEHLIPASIDWMDVIHLNVVHLNSANISRNASLTATLSYHPWTRSVDSPRDYSSVVIPMLTDGVWGTIEQGEAANAGQFPIGRNSPWLSRLGNVSIVKAYDNRNASLIFDISSSQFDERFCLPQSRMTVPASNGVTMFFGDFTNELFRYDHYRPSLLVENSIHQTLLHGSIVKIPWSWYDEIEALVVSHGARSMDNNLFSNCDVSSVQGLSTLRLDFHSVGVLDFTPEDYFAFNTDTNECYLKLEPSVDGSDILLINFLALRGVNFRLSNESIELCETSL